MFKKKKISRISGFGHLQPHIGIVMIYACGEIKEIIGFKKRK